MKKAVEKTKEETKVKKWHIFAVLIVIAVLAGGAGGFVAGRFFVNPSTKIETSVIEAEGDVIAKAADNIGASVVSIVTEQTNTTNSIMSLFGGSQSYTTQAAGTGVVVSGDGHVITNKHVIPDTTTKVTIVLRDGTEYDNVEVVDRDPTNDIAFLKINDVKGLTYAEIGSSSDLKIGTKVITVGNALGEFQNTVTAGIVSGLNRSITVNNSGSMNGETLSDLIQTDAAINSGNSGGPLVTYDGKVVGITTAVASGADNIGFAIPSDSFNNSIKSVISKGKIEKPYLGVYYTMITKAIAKDKNLIVENGAYIGYGNQKPTVDGSPADKAGLQAGDIIIKINDEELTEQNTLSSVISRHNAGDKVTLTIMRDGTEITIDLTLDVYQE